ncbi:hypothetical protein NCS57_00355900 [Fusarium keratoplasticum]|uniref:Uncharacterized protein n=1 Tax=Fusarium keratoplasticum TaxID=1328300 RepID=A0ACC0R4L1_9HYPO|nr:hypothetical protein NCS57_00355900 [Fusarium keratoplasticum]KAI8674577.1 hypothetical protein NCS57_00355900 [Fusarium keratoplasticum]
MRSALLLQLAFGLLAVDSAAASPCRPGTTTTAVTSTASYETSSSMAGSTTSVASSASSTTESSVETSASSTISEGISIFSTTTETSASSASETTASSSTTEATTTSTTSTAPTVTFSIVATGSGPVEGENLETYDRSNNVAVFGQSFDTSARPFYIDAQGRLINDQDFYLCGFYDGSNETPNVPAEVGTCVDESPMARVFLKCQTTADLQLTCSIPAISCVGDPNAFFGTDPICVPADVSSVVTDSTIATRTTTTPKTSTEPGWGSIPTFSVLATGQGPVEGKGLRTYNLDGFSASFDTDFGLEVHPFTIDGQGRIAYGQGWYLCGQYAGTVYDPNVPAEVVTCDSEQPLTRAFLTCAQTENGNVTCSIPAVICEVQPGDLFFATCEPAPGTWNNLYARTAGSGYILNIGDSSAPDYYCPIELSVEAA